ncbi:hypothetical protein FQN54_003195 [Arachnomyces sp. PD_36]|nr:hypothetical protein FQN54_003195 [Arachnomyces sp. PD_36]
MTLEPIQRHPRSSRPGGSMADYPYNGNSNYYPQDNSPTAINNHLRPGSKPAARQNSFRNASAPLDPNNMGNMKSRMLSCRRDGASEPNSRVPSPLSSPPLPVAIPNGKLINSPTPRSGPAPNSETMVNGSDSSNKSTDNGSSNPSSETENSNSEEARSQPDREDQPTNEKESDIMKEKSLPIPKELKSVVQPLTNLHYSCYQAHRSFAMSRNIYYPVPCMTCHAVDREVRWKCTFCCLRVCASCVEGLRACQRRSLKEFLGTLET